MTNTATKPTPSPQQIRTFLSAIHHLSHDKLCATMDETEPDLMLLEVLDDGLTQHALFDASGQIIGDWF